MPCATARPSEGITHGLIASASVLRPGAMGAGWTRQRRSGWTGEHGHDPRGVARIPAAPGTRLDGAGPRGHHGRLRAGHRLHHPTGRINGTAQLRQNNARYFQEYTAIQVELTRLIVDGEQGALEWTWSETRVADGLRRSVEDAIVFVIRDRKIVYWREYFDTAAFDS